MEEIADWIKEMKMRNEAKVMLRLFFRGQRKGLFP